MHRFPATTLADAVAPSLARWSQRREKHILLHGETLPESLQQFAADLEIDDPESLRLELTKRIPVPVPDPLVRLARSLGLPVFHPAGMCLGRGISAVSKDPAVLRHELVHTAQFQRLGGHFRFMHRYVVECLSLGYFDAPLEIEARERSEPPAER
ncbi:MAG: hypothetical protein AAGI48_16445 [Verrucomicrobiota bacterium]